MDALQIELQILEERIKILKQQKQEKDATPNIIPINISPDINSKKVSFIQPIEQEPKNNYDKTQESYKEQHTYYKQIKNDKQQYLKTERKHYEYIYKMKSYPPTKEEIEYSKKYKYVKTTHTRYQPYNKSQKVNYHQKVCFYGVTCKYGKDCKRAHNLSELGICPNEKNCTSLDCPYQIHSINGFTEFSKCYIGKQFALCKNYYDTKKCDVQNCTKIHWSKEWNHM